MATVAVHPPKTPVTKGSNTVAAATIPNVCKMPGPPAPFVPTPLPNIGRSALSPKDYSKKVKIEGNPVAIGGASFASQGDMASKGTGGGLVSSNTHGVTKFIMPGSFTVKIEGKGVHLLGEPMLNNCGPSGSPPNAATMQGAIHAPAGPPLTAEELLQNIANDCDKEVSPTHEKGSQKGNKKSCTKLGTDKHNCCEEKIQEHQSANPPNGKPAVEGERGYKRPALNDGNRPVPNPNGSYPTPSPTGGARPSLQQAFAQGGSAVGKAFSALKGNCFPDAAIINSDGSKTFVDFKFPCPKGHPSGKGTSKGGAKTAMSPKQQGSYDGLGFGTGNGPAIAITPR